MKRWNEIDKRNKRQLLIFLQSKHIRTLAGSLWREGKKTYCFQYNYDYLRKKSILSLGPKLPLRPNVFKSRTLFAPFEDRIPSRKNPAYPDYCDQWGISPDEDDPLILLSTIGHRGPSSFIFRLQEPERFGGEGLRAFRQDLGLSVREFGVFLDVEPTTINKTEMGKIRSSLLLSFCDVLATNWQALGYQLDKRGKYLHDNKIAKVKDFIKEKRG